MVGQVFWTAPFVDVIGKGQWAPWGRSGRCVRDRPFLRLHPGAIAAPPRLVSRVRAIDPRRPGHFAEHLELHDRRDGIFRRNGLPCVRGGGPTPLRARALGPGSSRDRHGVLRL